MATCSSILRPRAPETALGDAGGPLFLEDEVGEARVSGVGMDHGECIAMRPSVGGGTRACGSGGAIEPGYVL